MVGVCRYGVWKGVINYLWTSLPMDSSLEGTVTWCCTLTTQEAGKSISSTPGEWSRVQTFVDGLRNKLKVLRVLKLDYDTDPSTR